MKKALAILIAILCGISVFAQENPFLGRWALQAQGLPYGDGKMNMDITPDGGSVDQGGAKTHFTEMTVSGNNLKAAYEAMGFKVSFSLDLQADGSIKGKIMDMFELSGTRLEGASAAPSPRSTASYEPVTGQQLQGEWYGLYYGSPLTLTVDDNLTLVSEAFSSMNMTCGYKLSEGSPTRISLSGAATGMAGEGICAINGDSLEILLVFGAPGQVSAPRSFSDGEGNPAATHLSLGRDRSVIENATAKVEAPAAAALAFERNNRLGMGVNLNATLDGLSGDRPLKAGVVKDIAKQGFRSVRIPIRWADHTIKTAPYTIDPSFFAKVDAIVDECLASGLAVTLDNHYYPGISFAGTMDLPYEDNIDRLYCIWQQLSAHYKDYDDGTLYFELMNEPSLQLDPSLWNEIVASCIKIIRHDNPGKTVIVTTPSLGQHWTIGLLEFPADEWNIIVDAHYYLPQTFTHQGLSYAMAGDLKDIPWTGSEADKAPLEHDFAFLARWSERNCRPVNIGEYGVCANAPAADKSRYLAFVHSLLERYGFSSNLWAYHRDTFGIYDEASGKWNQEMLKAIR